MDKFQVISIIESTLKGGNNSPELFDISKLSKLKSILELCDSIDEVVALLEISRALISRYFGLNDSVITMGLNSIMQLRS